MRDWKRQAGKDTVKRSIIMHTNAAGVWTQIHRRRSQDFLWGYTFLSRKSLTTFLVVATSKHRLKLLNYPLPPSRFPEFSKKWTLALPRGARSAWGDALTTFPYKFDPDFFIRPGVHVHPVRKYAQKFSPCAQI